MIAVQSAPSLPAAVGVVLVIGVRIVLASSATNLFCVAVFFTCLLPVSSHAASSSSALVPASPASSCLSSFQKRRAAYQRFFNASLLARDPSLRDDSAHTPLLVDVSLQGPFNCSLPSPLPSVPARADRPRCVPMPVLCRLDFGLPLPPEPPSTPGPADRVRLFPPAPPPPAPPLPPHDPLLPEDGGGAGYWLSGRDRNRLAHALSGNTSSHSLSSAAVSSTPSQQNFRSFTFSLPASNVVGHFEWFWDVFFLVLHPLFFFSWDLLLKTLVIFAMKAMFSFLLVVFQLFLPNLLHFDIFPVTTSFSLSHFRSRFPSEELFFECGVPHRVHSSPGGRACSEPSVSCFSPCSSFPPSPSSQRARRWSCLSLSPACAASVGADVLPVSRSLSSDHSAAPVGVSTSQAPSDPAVVVAATPHCVTEVPRVGSGSRVPRPPAGFRAYPVLPRYPCIGGVPSQSSPVVGESRPGTARDNVVRVRCTRSVSAGRRRSRPLGSRVVSDERLSLIGVFAPSTNVVDLLEEPSDSVGRVRRSSSLPPAKVSSPDAVPLLHHSPARPSCAPGTPARNLPGPSRVNAASSGVLVPLPGPSSVVRPSRASFVIPSDVDPNAPSEELARVFGGVL